MWKIVMQTLTTPNWRLTSDVPGRLRLTVQTAFGWGPDLARRLAAEGIRSTRTGPFHVRIDGAAGIVALLKRLLPAAQRRQLGPLLDRYAQLQANVRGARTPHDVREERRAVVGEILSRLPAPATVDNMAATV